MASGRGDHAEAAVSGSTDATIAQFLTYLAKERDVSPHTLAAYGRDLEGLRAFLTEHLGVASVDWATVDRLQMRAWLASLARRGLAKRTSARMLSAARSFYRFLHRADLVEVNPARAVGSPKLDRHLPGHLDRTQIETVLTAAATRAQEGRFTDVRDRAILELFYSAGLRLSELRGIDRSDLDLLGGLVKVRGKGRKERIVPVGGPAQQALREYERAREQLIAQVGPSAERSALGPTWAISCSRARSYSRNACCAGPPTGTIRSLRPLPRTLTRPPSRSRSERSIPRNSLSRNPAE
ncbi:MAG: site-specific integrase [Gemmatimonadaceae bacterium]